MADQPKRHSQRSFDSLALQMCSRYRAVPSRFVTAGCLPHPRSSAYPASKLAVSVACRSLTLHFENSSVLFEKIYLSSVATEVNPLYLDTTVSWCVVSAHQASESNEAAFYLAAGDYYLHRLLSAAYRAMLWIPDRWFDRLLRYIWR